MTKPRTAYFPKDAKHEGVDITYVKSTKTLRVGGWYDSFCGLETEELSLREFLDRLGVTEKDCREAFGDEKGKKRKAEKKPVGPSVELSKALDLLLNRSKK